MATGSARGTSSRRKSAVIVRIVRRDAQQGERDLRKAQGVHHPEPCADEDQGLDIGEAIGERRSEPGPLAMAEHGGASGIDQRIGDHTGVGQCRVLGQDRFRLRGVGGWITHLRRRTDTPLVVAEDRQARGWLARWRSGQRDAAPCRPDRRTSHAGRWDPTPGSAEPRGYGGAPSGWVVELAVSRHPAAQRELHHLNRARHSFRAIGVATGVPCARVVSTPRPRSAPAAAPPTRWRTMARREIAVARISFTSCTRRSAIEDLQTCLLSSLHDLIVPPERRASGAGIPLARCSPGLRPLISYCSPTGEVGPRRAVIPPEPLARLGAVPRAQGRNRTESVPTRIA